MSRPATALALALTLALTGCLGGRGFDPRAARFPLLAVTPPVPSEARLAGGVPVYLLEDRDVPLVRVYLAFRGGSLYDPSDLAGLADVTELAWRTGGAGGLSPEEVDDALDGRGMELGVSLGRETGWITLSCLPGDLADGLDLLARVVLAPAFREDRVGWARSQVAEQLRREGDDPQRLAFRELRRALYPGHPRGVIPTPETAGRVERAHVVDLHRRLVSGGAWLVGAVGDFDRAELLRELAARFGGLPGDGGEFLPLPAPAEPEPRTVLVRRPLPQVTLVWARLGPGRAEPGFYALDLADHVLGSGGFQSRLVRE
ncbi:MAG: M16 family metallopeptidase, partial [Deferrisomatales bacterium]